MSLVPDPNPDLGVDVRYTTSGESMSISEVSNLYIF